MKKLLRPFSNKKAIGGSDETTVGGIALNYASIAISLVLIVSLLALFVTGTRKIVDFNSSQIQQRNESITK